MTALTPFFFAMVDSDQTTFDASMMNVVDAQIFNFHLQHDEGQIPWLEITIQNPYVGLLSASRKTWAWFSYQPPDGSSIIPLFFGELVGIPSNLFDEIITVKYIARSMEYIQLKQAAAETLKQFPNYDPIFLTVDKRDDPDAILEGWSALYHVDRTTLAVTASAILVGEDGTIVFEEGDAYYDGVSLELGEAPLNNVQVQMDVHWTQRCIGYLNGPDVNVVTYTGDTFMGDWPKPGQGLGGGWTVESSFVNDVYMVNLTPMANYSFTWTLGGKGGSDFNVGDCSTASSSSSASWPALLSPNALSFTMTESGNSGICDPFGDPPDQPPVNVGASWHVTGMVVPQWTLNCSWTLRYEARRTYTEQVFIDIQANTQAVLTSPTVEQDTETIKISGADVGQPIVVYKAWTDFAGKSVELATLCFPNDPITPGGMSYQVCVQAGVAGTVEPIFSDVPGVTTDDNYVVWASLGESPLENIPEFEFAMNCSPGIYIYQQKVFDPNQGALVETGNASYYLVTEQTQVTSTYTQVTYVPPVTDSDQATPAPITINIEQFDPPSNTVFLGNNPPPYLGIPIGGSPDFVTANNYFPSDRGVQSLGYGICRARARMHMRARCIKLAWDCPFEYVTGLSCRMNATLHDPRLPGGIATGKIISYTMSCDGQSGQLKGHVEIGVAAGFGGTSIVTPGDPEYVETGYIETVSNYQYGDMYQDWTNPIIQLFPTDDNDISFTPPEYAPFDDGLIFPLTSLPSDGGIFSGDAATQAEVITKAAPISSLLAEEPNLFNFPTPSSDNASVSGTITPAAAWWLVAQQIYYTTQTVPYVMEANPVSWTITIDPVVNGPFNGAYTVTTSTLEIPMGIDLTASGSNS